MCTPFRGLFPPCDRAIPTPGFRPGLVCFSLSAQCSTIAMPFRFRKYRRHSRSSNFNNNEQSPFDILSEYPQIRYNQKPRRNCHGKTGSIFITPPESRRPNIEPSPSLPNTLEQLAAVEDGATGSAGICSPLAAICAGWFGIVGWVGR